MYSSRDSVMVPPTPATLRGEADVRRHQRNIRGWETMIYRARCLTCHSADRVLEDPGAGSCCHFLNLICFVLYFWNPAGMHINNLDRGWCADETTHEHVHPTQAPRTLRGLALRWSMLTPNRSHPRLKSRAGLADDDNDTMSQAGWEISSPAQTARIAAARASNRILLGTTACWSRMITLPSTIY